MNSSPPLNVGCALYASSQAWQALFLSFFLVDFEILNFKPTLKNYRQTLVNNNTFPSFI
jgi:hypothetical protein